MLKTLHLFAGAGGGLLADLILGHEPVCAVEWDPYCCQVLRERASEGWFPGLQVFEGDVRLFPASDWKGRVDCINAGFPCQPHSVAGKREGHADDRNLWPEVVRVIGEIRPGWVFLENVPGLISNGFIGTVLSDLARLGYDARWTVLGADQVGAPHRRDRWWCLAYPVCGGAREKHGSPPSEIKNPPEQKRGRQWDQFGDGGQDVAYPRREHEPGDTGELETNTAKRTTGIVHVESSGPGQDVAYTTGQQGWGSVERAIPANVGTASQDIPHTPNTEPNRRGNGTGRGRARSGDVDGYGAEGTLWWETESKVGRVADGISYRVDRLKSLGNAQVPLQAALAFEILMGRMG
jgi:DNA (cytosine-5)-methyltransferase 1